MLPTPSTSHVNFNRVYEPAEDSFLLLDTLSASSEIKFLSERFKTSPPPLIMEVGSGSGVVLAFVAAHANHIFGRSDSMFLSSDLNVFACHSTSNTVLKAIDSASSLGEKRSLFLNSLNADLLSCLKANSVDVLIFNPPYVPTSEVPERKASLFPDPVNEAPVSFDDESHFLSLSYAGGVDGMEVTNRLLEDLPRVLHRAHGVAYILLCAQNRPREVQSHVKAWGPSWEVEIVSSSGKKAGWEKLVVLRVSRAG
ncbi:hypothetical protein P152DRAFT_460334 [Eremomyces bilateralis CBS 781.70]|uniref:Methyltransferase n=1 Tax=Eremomyces bilateralis CBS 781.70 TaxID=1392243 RepID=A0A6G1FXS5_9PEZI|nr:uncharacterized protein P152DRAFT_460334 [Eremomyces bilateralis CBS 781.70]KAF1810637.1 hypothetical protein P152DRAFT_460334 [Eremomyces bilateralis CBS 781.70]